jgi:NAD dependent epimerase/dehydratase family enzyme
LFDLALSQSTLQGPINGVGPYPVTNREFSRILGKSIRRPCWLPAPKFGLRIALGEFAHFITMSQRIIPGKALELGYEFKHPELEEAFRELFSDRRH